VAVLFLNIVVIQSSNHNEQQTDATIIQVAIVQATRQLTGYSIEGMVTYLVPFLTFVSGGVSLLTAVSLDILDAQVPGCLMKGLPGEPGSVPLAPPDGFTTGDFNALGDISLAGDGLLGGVALGGVVLVGVVLVGVVLGVVRTGECLSEGGLLAM